MRRATHAAHVRINHHSYLAGLVKPGYPLAKYQALLAMYCEFYGAIEEQIETFLARHNAPFAYGSRRKHPWLLEDLAHFRMDIQDGKWSPPQLPPQSTLDDMGALIGTLYVIEGATLGGQVISRHLQNQMGLGATTGARFFNGYGDDSATCAHWQSFCDFANTGAASPALQASAEQSAVRIFELIELQLDALHDRLSQ
jgi:heme oxygenase